MNEEELEVKYSGYLAHSVPPEIRQNLESELIGELLQDLPGDVGAEEIFNNGLRCWDISNGGTIEGQLSTYQWDDGEIDSCLTFFVFEEGRNADQAP